MLLRAFRRRGEVITENTMQRFKVGHEKPKRGKSFMEELKKT